jgi:hypothetical protein
MANFEVLAEGILIGHSELEHGDAPMGVAEGRLLPLPAYRKLQPMFVAMRDSTQAHLTLAVRTAEHRELPAQGGVRIRDYSAELGDEEIWVEVNGIGYPLYEELFPHHVESYRLRFLKVP